MLEWFTTAKGQGIGTNGFVALFNGQELRSELMDIPVQLTLEQQFKMKVYQEQVKTLSQEEAQQYLLEVMRQMMVKENLFKHLLKNA